MIISTKRGTPQEEIKKIIDSFEAQGLSVTLIRGTDYNVFGLVGDTTKLDEKIIAANPWVDSVTRVAAPYKKANRLFHEADTIVDVGGVKIGGQEKIAVIGGPCSVEGEEETIAVAKAVKEAGGTLLRGGAYKPRTSPYAFQGLEEEGLRYMKEAREATGLAVVCEVTSQRALETAANCGVLLLATAHGRDVDDLSARPLYRRLLSLGLFHRAVCIQGRGEGRRYRVIPLDGAGGLVGSGPPRPGAAMEVI